MAFTSNTKDSQHRDKQESLLDSVSKNPVSSGQARGCLATFVNTDLWAQEDGAFERAIVEKHARQ